MDDLKGPPISGNLQIDPNSFFQHSRMERKPGTLHEKVSQLAGFFKKWPTKNLSFYSRLKWDVDPAVVYTKIMWYVILQQIDTHLSPSIHLYIPYI